MRYTAKLATHTHLERPVQKFAPDAVNADAAARGILGDASRVAGDRVEIYETKPVLVGTLVLMSDGSIQKEAKG